MYFLYEEHIDFCFSPFYRKVLQPCPAQQHPSPRSSREGRLPSAVSQKLIKLEMRKQAPMKRRKLNSFPLLWNSARLFRKEHTVSFHSRGRFSGLCHCCQCSQTDLPEVSTRKAQPPRYPPLRWWPLGGHCGQPAKPLLCQTRHARESGPTTVSEAVWFCGSCLPAELRPSVAQVIWLMLTAAVA